MDLGRPKKTRLFGGGFCISLLFLYTYAPPPVEEDIIMTTTIIIEVMAWITLYTLFFNIRVYALRIYTRRPNKELWQAIIF
jgi:hypothetical protein